MIRGDGSWWWAGSLQQAYRWLEGRDLDPRDVVLIANDDTRFDADFLAAGRAALVGRRGRCLLAQLLQGQSGEFIELGVHVNWRRLRLVGAKEPERVNCFSTRGLFMAATDFLELGSVPPRLLPHYMSDYEFTIRAHHRGYALISDPGEAVARPDDDGDPEVARTSVRAYLRSTLTKRSGAQPDLVVDVPRAGMPPDLAAPQPVPRLATVRSGLLTAARGERP